MSKALHIRFAGKADRQELRSLQAYAMRRLAAPYYDEAVIEGFIAEIGTMDDTLIEDGTYFVATTADGRIAGCGGWSWRTPGYATRLEAGLPATVTKATVRSIYVHPDFVRRGIASAVMGAIESEVASAGFDTVSLTATLSGVPLYRRLGYVSGSPVTLSLTNGRLFVGLGMTKQLSACNDLKSAA